jgi:hypothetical protein
MRRLGVIDLRQQAARAGDAADAASLGADAGAELRAHAGADFFTGV